MDFSSSDDSENSEDLGEVGTEDDQEEELSFLCKTIGQKRKIFKMKSSNSLAEFIREFNCITEYCKQDEYDPFFIINSVLYCNLPFPNTIHQDLLKSLNLPVKPLETLLKETKIKKRRTFMYHHSLDCKHLFRLSNVTYPLYIAVLPLCSVCEMNRPAVVVGKDADGMYTNSLWCKSCFDEFHTGMDMNEIESMEIEWKPL